MGNKSGTLVKSIQDFTVDFHKILQASEFYDGNLVCSTLGMYLILAMTASGAEDKTLQEINQVLHQHTSTRDVKKFLKEFRDLINDLNKVTNISVRMANKFFTFNDLSMKEEFKDFINTNFRSESNTINFKKKEEPVKVINLWCSNYTNKKITKLVEKNDASDNTALILLNIAYFKGNWLNAFEKEVTRLKSFYLTNTDVIKVPTMFADEKFFFSSIKDYAWYIVLPYKNPDFYMVIVEPNFYDGFKFIENNLEELYNVINPTDYKRFKQKRYTRLYLPKFKVETTIELNGYLQQLGLEEIFTDEANLKGISDEPLYVKKVVQTAVIEVHEYGCGRTERSSIPFALECSRHMLEVNRPFFYIIFHKSTILFSGHIVNPSQ